MHNGRHLHQFKPILFSLNCMILLGGLIILVLAGGCQDQASQQVPTLAVAAATLTPSPETGLRPVDTPAPTVPPTWTVLAMALVSPTAARGATITPVPTNTPFPTLTATPTATISPTETAVVTPTVELSPTPTLVAQGDNILPNPSFELGWYHVSGIPEIQIPRDWDLGWKVGKNDLDPDPWNIFVAPESRVLSVDFLPAGEHATFIWDGRQTLKVFKQTGAIYFWLATTVELQPGSYLFEVNVYPDLIDGYREDGSKIWAPDPESGEVRFIFGDEIDNWMLPRFGQKNTYTYAFSVDETQQVRIGMAFRGRWAIQNNGWFMDDWSLTQLSPEP